MVVGRSNCCRIVVVATADFGSMNADAVKCKPTLIKVRTGCCVDVRAPFGVLLMTRTVMAVGVDSVSSESICVAERQRCDLTARRFTQRYRLTVAYRAPSVLSRPRIYHLKISISIPYNTANVKYSTHGAYIEYDTLNFSMSTAQVLKMYSV